MSLKPNPRLNFNVYQLGQLASLAKSFGLEELHIQDSKVYQCRPEKNKTPLPPLLLIDLQSTLGPCISFHVNVNKLAKLVEMFKKTKEQNIVMEEYADYYKIINRESSIPAIALPDLKIPKLSTKQASVYKLSITKEDFNRVCEPFCLKKDKIADIKKIQHPIKTSAIEFLIYGFQLKALGFGCDDNPHNNRRPNDYMVNISPFLGVSLSQDPEPDLILMSDYSAPVHFKYDATIKLLLQHSRQQYWMLTRIDVNGIDIRIYEPLKIIYKQERMRSEEEIMSIIQKLTEGQ